MTQKRASLGDLWQQCAQENPGSAAWESLWERIRPAIEIIAWRVAVGWDIREKELVEDLVQEICLKITEQARSGTLNVPMTSANFEAYLKAMAANAARDSLRRRFARKRGVDATGRIDDHLDELAGKLDVEHLDKTVLLQQLRDMVEGSSRDRAIFWLYYHQGLTAKEIATVHSVGLAPKGVESLIHRMTETLRQRMESHPATAQVRAR